MNRAEAAAYIGERFGAYLNAVGRTAADSSAVPNVWYSAQRTSSPPKVAIM